MEHIIITQCLIVLDNFSFFLYEIQHFAFPMLRLDSFLQSNDSMYGFRKFSYMGRFGRHRLCCGKWQPLIILSLSTLLDIYNHFQNAPIEIIGSLNLFNLPANCNLTSQHIFNQKLTYWPTLLS